MLVAGPGREQIPDTMFFARKLRETGCRLGPVVVNRVHPRVERLSGDADHGARHLLHWLGERDHQGLAELSSLLPGQPPRSISLLPEAPNDLASLEGLANVLLAEPALLKC